MERLQQNLSISVPTLSQLAALAAFDARDELDVVKAGYARNRDRLAACGFIDIHPVDGAFYVYADAGRFTNDSVRFCQSMLQKPGVAATPGVDFDRERGHRTIRFSFDGAHEEMIDAMDRFDRWLAGR